MATFKAIVIEKADNGQTVALADFDEGDLMDGDVTVRVEWSTVNYKDGLALTGKAPVVRRFPMIPGIDFAGTRGSSSHPDWKPGDKVILNGWGLGETHLGAYAREGPRQRRLAGAAAGRHERARGHGDRHGRLHRDAVRDGAGAPRRRAGATGRSSSPVRRVASARSRSRCWRSSATRDRLDRPPAGGGLSEGPGRRRDHRPQPSCQARPSRSPRSAGPAASIRSARTTLANVLSMTRYGGAVAACGLAGGMDLPRSVAPFILRGVSLLGIDSVMCPLAVRREAWKRLATDLDRGKLPA